MSLVLPKNPNVFANSPLDRAAHLRTNQDWLAGALSDKRTLFIPVWKLMPFLIKNREGRREAGWITGELALPLMRPGATTIFLGVHRDTPHFAIDVSKAPDPSNDGPLAGLGLFADLRTVAEEIDPGDAAIDGLLLDFEQGGEIAVSLRRLYEYMLTELIAANTRNSTSHLDGPLRCLKTLREGWQEVVARQQPAVGAAR